MNKHEKTLNTKTITNQLSIVKSFNKTLNEILLLNGLGEDVFKKIDKFSTSASNRITRHVLNCTEEKDIEELVIDDNLLKEIKEYQNNLKKVYEMINESIDELYNK